MPAYLSAFWNQIVGGHALVATGIVVLLLLMIRVMVLRFAWRNIEDQFVRLRYKRAVSYASFFIAVVLLLPIWLPSIRNIATFLGIFGAGFLIVTREIWVSMGGWLYITVRRPYIIGDRIQIGPISGDVIDIRLMETSIMEASVAESTQPTGRIIYFPNAKIFTEVVATHSRRFAHVFVELHVRLSNNANWEKASALLEQLAKEHYATALAAKQQLTTDDENIDLVSGYRNPRVHVAMEGSEIVLHLQFMAPSGQGANISDRVWRSFLSAARQNDDIRFSE